MNSPLHIPPYSQNSLDDLLMDYVAGTLPEALQIAVESHMCLNRDAAEKVEILTITGGLLLDSLEGETPPDGSFERLMARIDAQAALQTHTAQKKISTVEYLFSVTDDLKKFDAETRGKVPPSVRPYLNANLKDLKWRSLGKGVKEFVLPITRNGKRIFKASLLEIGPGQKIPRHTHRGEEYTIILHGSYEDKYGSVSRGDMVLTTPADTHQPCADPDTGCLCLAVLTAPLKFKGAAGLLLNPLQHL